MRASSPGLPARSPVLSIGQLQHELRNPWSGESFQVRVPEFTIHTGEFIGLVGPTGCGKSTLLEILATLRKASAVVRFFLQEHDIVRLQRQGRKRQIDLIRSEVIGFAPQRPQLIPAFRIGENVEIPLRLNHRSGSEERVHEVLGWLSRPYTHGTPDLIRVARNLPHSVSGGQAQRVGLARALVHRPALLLLDEPTSNLDDRTARHVMTVLETIRHAEGTAIVMSTHDERLLRLFADRLVRMDVVHDGLGQIVEDIWIREPSVPNLPDWTMCFGDNGVIAPINQ